MKYMYLERAEEEARRFIRAVTGLRNMEKLSDEQQYIGPSKWSGAVRRASMDLTRALADLRQSG